MLVLILSICLAFLDQSTKYLIRCNLATGNEIVVVPGFFSISHVHNTGAAWGMFSGMSGWLVVVSIVMLVVIVFFRHSFMSDSRLDRIAVGLMIAGITGNLIDRIRLGYVVDFLHFYWRGHHFPSFNVADSAICVGVGLYILVQFLLSRQEDTGSVGSAAASSTDRHGASESVKQ